MDNHLIAGKILREKGFAAPTSKGKFEAWLQQSETAKAALLEADRELASAYGLELEIDSRLADLIVAEGASKPTPELGRRVLDLDLHRPDLVRQLREHPEAGQVLLGAVDAWKDQISGQAEAAAARLAHSIRLNQQEQARAQAAGNPIVRGFAEARSAERKRQLRELERQLDAATR